MAETLCDDAIALDNCPGCGQEIRWEHPRSRVRGIVWHAECLSSARTDYRAGKRSSDKERMEKFRRMRKQAHAAAGVSGESIRAFLSELQMLNERVKQQRDNIHKMRRGRR